MFTDRRQFIAALAGTAAACLTRSAAAAPLPVVSPSALAADPRRPQYHLLPAANWMNDPNGPIFWNGNYHMFYQHNPHAAVWGDMHWGHAISPDMVHWRHLPVALAPTPGGPDASGCFTGSALRDGDRVAILYTGVVDTSPGKASPTFRESQCLAYVSGSDLSTWRKEAAAVIPAPPPHLDVTGFRDPAPWRQDEVWLMAVGSGIRGQGGAVLLYRSADLRHWDYLHPLALGSSTQRNSADPVASGDMWECPDFFPLGDRHVLIHSTQGKSFWQSGRFDTATLTFHPERGGLLDHGTFYAPKSQLDEAGNRILWGWIPESRPVAEYSAAGWAGLMSLPRILTLDSSGDLRISVAAAVNHLRERPQRLTPDTPSLTGLRLEQACGEVLCTLQPGDKPLELSLGPDSAPAWLRLRFEPSTPGAVVIEDQAVPLRRVASDPIRLRLLVDGSVVECFINDQAAFTRRFYFSGSSAPAASIHFSGPPQALESLSVAQMKPVSPDRLTT